jgi:hypothetical protein
MNERMRLAFVFLCIISLAAPSCFCGSDVREKQFSFGNLRGQPFAPTRYTLLPRLVEDNTTKKMERGGLVLAAAL